MKYLSVVLFAASALAAPAKLAPLNPAAPGVETSGNHIVVLKDDANVDSVLSTLGLASGSLAHVYTGNLKGFAGEFNPATLALIRANPFVSYIEEDSIMHSTVTQNGADYGLGITSQQGAISSSQQSTYYYKSNAGSGATVYVVDTGIYTSNVDFGSRARFVANYISGSPNTDENGHGTHCSGSVGGTTYGVSKSVQLRGVKVLDKNGSGATSGIISGINYAVSNCETPGKCVISMSLGGSYQSSLNQAVTNAVNNGVTTVVAAGNEGQDACNVSPASAPGSITVGAIDGSYTRPSFSNYGQCVDIFAPGVNIKSDWIGSTTATNTISGTSMATPHIAGLAAYFLSFGLANSPSSVLSALQKYGQSNLISNPNGSPNLIGNNGWFKGVQ